MFFKATENTDALSQIFDTNKSLEVKTKKFLKRLNGFIQDSFKKVKISEKYDHKLEELYDKRRYLRTKDDGESNLELEAVEKELAERYSDKMFKTIEDELKAVKGEDGGYNPGHLWKLKKKLSSGQNDPPTAMKDEDGNLLTSEEEIKNEALKHYKKVFEDKAIDEDLTDQEVEREKLCADRLDQAAKNKTEPWTTKNVEAAIRSLNMGTSKDPYGLPNELFKKGVAGKGLINAIVKLMNAIKESPKEYPSVMELCNVTSIYKNKGDRNFLTRTEERSEHHA